MNKTLLPFYKYHGAGNDFILLDQRDQELLDPADQPKIEFLCHRHFGIGADGLIFLEAPRTLGADFYMRYMNADGREGSMCGNGARCIVAFAYHLGIIDKGTRFEAIDGWHEAHTDQGDWVELKMADVLMPEVLPDGYFLDTGSPHHVTFVEGLKEVDVFREGKAIRYDERYRGVGTNVNFVEVLGGQLHIRTYERGVENETLACGTGVTAAALVYSSRAEAPQKGEVAVKALGGDLRVRYERGAAGFTDVWLCGPAQKVFEGAIWV